MFAQGFLIFVLLVLAPLASRVWIVSSWWDIMTGCLSAVGLILYSTLSPNGRGFRHTNRFVRVLEMAWFVVLWSSTVSSKALASVTGIGEKTIFHLGGLFLLAYFVVGVILLRRQGASASG